jgi:crotonobetainyl-CoA:carnitine CoA-transferase CaiB-like acyl-CoA transferase
MAGALNHIRVLDLSRILAGPWAGQMLADLGAEVIKIEKPGTGDDTRSWGPPYLRDGSGADTSESAYYLGANRGKKSVAVDISDPAGQEIVRRLAAQADVVIENFKVGGLRKYGLDYESLKTINPRLVYCSITGFGQTGPYADRPGYDFAIQAMGGLMSVTGQPDGAPGGGPQKVGVAIADVMSGLYATIAILAAIESRHTTGRGQHIDLALLDVQVATLANQAMNYLTSGIVPRRLGNAHPNIVPYQSLATADGHIVLAVGNDGQFGRLCTLIGRPEWATDARFATNRERVRNRAVLIPMLEDVLRQRPGAEWLALFDAEDIPCGPINSIAQVFQDAQVRHRGLRVDLPHPLAGTVPTVANPIRLSATPIEHAVPPPLLGEHTEAVLRDRLGMDGRRIAELRREGVIQ